MTPHTCPPCPVQTAVRMPLASLRQARRCGAPNTRHTADALEGLGAVVGKWTSDSSLALVALMTLTRSKSQSQVQADRLQCRRSAECVGSLDSSQCQRGPMPSERTNHNQPGEALAMSRRA